MIDETALYLAELAWDTYAKTPKMISLDESRVEEWKEMRSIFMALYIYWTCGWRLLSAIEDESVRRWANELRPCGYEGQCTMFCEDWDRGCKESIKETLID